MTVSLRTILGIVATAAAVAAVVGGFMLVDSPAEARLKRLDGRRVEDLRQIASAVDGHWARHQTLPASPAEALAAVEWQAALRDPVTEEPYPYRVIDARQYELCATFDRASDAPPSRYGDPFWSHTAGQQCFTLKGRERGR